MQMRILRPMEVLPLVALDLDFASIQMVLQSETPIVLALTLMMMILSLTVLSSVAQDPSRGPQEALEEESAALYSA